jgi:hypothetical protein
LLLDIAENSCVSLFPKGTRDQNDESIKAPSIPALDHPSSPIPPLLKSIIQLRLVYLQPCNPTTSVSSKRGTVDLILSSTKRGKIQSRELSAAFLHGHAKMQEENGENRQLPIRTGKT